MDSGNKDDLFTLNKIIYELENLVNIYEQQKISDFVLTSTEVAQILKVKETTVTRKAKLKHLPGELISGVWLFRPIHFFARSPDSKKASMFKV